MILSNEAGFVLDGYWELPDQNTTGVITNVDNFTFVLGVENDDSASGTLVITEPLVMNDTGQQWEIGVDNTENGTGYFTIKNPYSEKFLTAITAENGIMILTIEGIFSSYKHTYIFLTIY